MRTLLIVGSSTTRVVTRGATPVVFTPAPLLTQSRAAATVATAITRRRQRRAAPP